MSPQFAVNLTAADCVEALRARYRAPAYALLEQVANGTGWKADRFADVVVMSLWPSRGLTVTGFEIKVTRHDYRRELLKPNKNAEIQGYCDHWYIVTPRRLFEDQDLVDFPKTWGLMEVTAAKKLKVVRHAPELEAKPLTRHFVAAVLRRQAEAADGVLERERERARREGAERGHGELARRLEEANKTTARLKRAIDDFEAASGVKIGGYYHHNSDIGAAVKTVLDAGARRDFLEELEHRLEHLDGLAQACRRDLDTMRALPRHGGSNGQGKDEEEEEERTDASPADAS